MTGRALLFGLLFASFAKADHFDDHTLAVLRSVEQRKDAPFKTSFTLAELAGMPKTVQGSPQSVLLVVRTDENNWCKLLVRAAGIKRKGWPQPKPFLHVERLVTYSADPRRGVLADKRDLYLFVGFGIDLDIGQVVAKGDGEDLTFNFLDVMEFPPSDPVAAEERGRQLQLQRSVMNVAAAAKLFLPQVALVPAKKQGSRPKAGGAVTAADYPGKYKLDVDGRFTGVLELKNDAGKLTGTFTSEQGGAVFQANGGVGTPAQHLTLSIAFPRTDLKLDGRLFTRGRAKIAGLATMEDNVFGFVAERID